MVQDILLEDHNLQVGVLNHQLHQPMMKVIIIMKVVQKQPILHLVEEHHRLARDQDFFRDWDSAPWVVICTEIVDLIEDIIIGKFFN